MPPIQYFAPPAGIKSPPLSFAARTGDLLFVSGIPGFDANGALPNNFEAHFGFVVRNIKHVLDEAGATFRDLVKVNVLARYFNVIASPLRSTLAISPTCWPDSSSTAPFWLVSTMARAPPPTARPAPAAP
jgi:2-iminobutanoate/2-iminopropanoate deaminase